MICDEEWRLWYLHSRLSSVWSWQNHSQFTNFAKSSGCGIEVLGTAVDLRACNDVWGRGVAWLKTTVQSKGYEIFVFILTEAVGVVVFPRGLTIVMLLCWY